MADLSITAANVKPSDDAVIRRGVAGETITAGKVLYKDSVTGKLLLAQADGTQAEARAVGMALGGGADGQPLEYQTAGDIEVGAGTVGLIYIVAAAAGDLSPHTDATTPASSEYCTVFACGIGSNKLRIGIVYGGELA